jgi:hypothetical protein
VPAERKMAVDGMRKLRSAEDTWREP